MFAGTAGSVPSARRGMPALLVRRGAERILVDCGEGTQRQLLQSGGLSDITDVFITHLHVDHWLGLPGMLQTFSMRDRERALTIHGPDGLAELMRSMRRVYGRLSFPVEVVELEAGDAVRRDDLEIQAINVRHRVLAYGYVLVEDERPGRFDAELAESLGVAPGPDFGRLQRGEVVGGVHPEQVIGAPREGRKVVVSGDTAPCEPLAIAAHGADLLIHEATFSYSSCHALFATIVYGVWAWFVWRSDLPRPVRLWVAPLLVLWACGILWSRLALGAHYITDLIGGVLLGVTALALASGVRAAPARRRSAAGPI